MKYCLAFSSNNFPSKINVIITEDASNIHGHANPFLPKFREDSIEGAKQVSNTCTECNQCIHVCRAMFGLFPGIDKKLPAKPYYNRGCQKSIK